MDEQPDHEYEADALQMVYAKTLYTLRESRKELLKQYAVENEAEMLEKIAGGVVGEHPAYEHYLGALIIDQMRLQIRAQAAEQMSGVTADVNAEIGVHLMLKDKIEGHYGDRLDNPVQMAQDALLLSFDSGLMVEVRYFSPDEYSIGWRWGDAELRIDTAPVHADCSTFPNHLHNEGGVVRADTVTAPGAACWLNFSLLMDILLVDPLLEGRMAVT